MIKDLSANFFKLMKYRKKEVALAVAILLIASILRLYRINTLSVFAYDQARDALYTKRLVVDHKLRLIGPQASPGFYTGPAYYYLMAPFLLLSNLDPSGIDVGVAFFSIASVMILFYLLTKITKNYYLSFIISLLYSVQPQILFQSRFSWNPNLTPFFTLLFILGLFYVLKNKSIGWIIAAFSLGFLIQLHLTTLCLIPVFLLFVFLLRKNRKIFDQKFLFSLIALFFMLLPFAVIELRHNFPNLRNLIKVTTKGFDTNLPPPPFLQGIWEKIHFLFVGLPFGVEKIFPSVIILLFLATVIFLAFKKKKIGNIEILIFSPIFFLILMSIFYRGSFFQYYLTFLYPIPFLVIGVIFSSFWRIKNLYLLVFLPIVFLNLKSDLNLYRSGSTLDNLKIVSRLISNDNLNNKSFNIVGIRGGDRYDHNGVDYRYFLETFYHKRALDWDVVDYQKSEVLYIISNLGKIDPMNLDVWEVGLFSPKQILQTWSIDQDVIIYKLGKNSF